MFLQDLKNALLFVLQARSREEDYQNRVFQERLYYLDLARGLAVLFMINLHVMMIYASTQAQSLAPGGLIMLLGTGPGAPVFMFLMGTFLIYGRPRPAGEQIIRGIKLFLLGYLLNATRWLPIYLGLYAGVVDPERVLPLTPFTLMTYVDILQFAGLALIVLALLKLLLKRPVAWIGLAVAAAGFAPLLWGRASGIFPLDMALQLFWGDGANIAFPFFPWIAYPLLGMAFGQLLVESRDLNKLFRNAFSAGLLLFLAGGILSLGDPAFHMGDYFRSGPGSVLMITGFIFAWLSVCYWVTDGIKGGALYNLLFYWSDNVTVMYFIHWVLIVWGAGFIVGEFNTVDLNSSLAWMALIVPLTSALCYLWISLTGKKVTRLAALIYGGKEAIPG